MADFLKKNEKETKSLFFSPVHNIVCVVVILILAYKYMYFIFGNYLD